MSAPFNRVQLLRRIRTVEGYSLILEAGLMNNLLEGCMSAEESFSDWEDGHGFGSSDMTYAMKEAIDDAIGGTNLATEFSPCLTIAEKLPPFNEVTKLLEKINEDVLRDHDKDPGEYIPLTDWGLYTDQLIDIYELDEPRRQAVVKLAKQMSNQSQTA